MDAIFTGGGDADKDLRAMFNAGYKRTAYVARCVGEGHSVQRFPVYSPVLVGLVGGMSPTFTARAITVHMRRKKREDPEGSQGSRTQPPGLDTPRATAQLRVAALRRQRCRSRSSHVWSDTATPW